VGTFASWGQNGFKVQQLTLEQLGLGIPDTCWHAARDRIAEVMSLFGLIASTGARIAKEVYNLSKTEIGELEEPFNEGKVGSSTMPHKRNPIHSEWAIVLSKILRSNAGLAMDAMVQENERDASAWKAEWIIVPESSVMLSSLLSHLDSIFAGLIVRKEQMQINMNRLKGLLLSEPLMFTLAKSMPLPIAYEKVYQASMRAFEKETPLLDELLIDPDINKNYSAKHLETALEPSNYLGLCDETITRVKTKVASIINGHA
jgi:adenylosuccinate lyase